MTDVLVELDAYEQVIESISATELLEIVGEEVLTIVGPTDLIETVEQAQILDAVEQVEFLEIALQGPPGANGSAGIEVPFAWGDATPKAVVVVPVGKLVYGVQIAISEAFDGVGPSLAVGDSGQLDRLMAVNQNDPTAIGAYLTSPVYRYAGNTALSLAIVPGVGATAGRGLLTVFIEH